MLMLASSAPAGAKLPRSRRQANGPASRPRATPPLAVPLALGFLLLLSAGFGLYALQRMRSLDREMSSLRERTERRIQKLDAGISFDSRRQQLLLGIRDEILAVNTRLGLDLAYEYSTELVTASEKYAAVDPLLLLAIGIVESGYEASATSRAQAKGLYQIWPSTGRMLAAMLGWPYTDALLVEPAKNTTLAAFYLHILFTAYNDESLVLAEYNGGPLNAGYLRAGDGRVSAETRRYVAKVLDLRQRLRKKFEQPEGVDQGRPPAREASRESRRLGDRPRPAPAARSSAAG